MTTWTLVSEHHTDDFFKKVKNQCSIISSQVERDGLKTLTDNFHYGGRASRNREGIKTFFFKKPSYFWGITGELRTLIIRTASSSTPPLLSLFLSHPAPPPHNLPHPPQSLRLSFILSRHASHLILINVFSGEPGWIQMKSSALSSQITPESPGYLTTYTSFSPSLLSSSWKLISTLANLSILW